ncbi:ComEC/Rec2 family competence protein [Emcibacter sp. SYSU 3D8]|uniref:ComEC/Rec2 family competence protein n=1 Tax=Emcibacter sp. SYSU 3D8 TaxID=3133969 RepID=UPI0031FEC098
MLVAERDRWALWVPVLTGCGIAGYFASAAEWPAWPVLVCAAVAGAAVLLLHGAAKWLAITALCIALGLAAAAVRSQLVSAPAITAETRMLSLSGRVDKVERFSPKEMRLTLSTLVIEGWTPASTPARVRVGVRTRGDDVRPGNLVSLRAVLMPPPGPSVPGGYDFSRHAWFDRLGAVGFAVSAVKVTGQAADWGGWRVARWRDDIGRRLLAQADGDTGAMAVALVTGERAGMSEETLETLRVAGIAHLLAISGMNIAMMTGFVFVVVRFLLACLPGVALRYPIKRWAAVAALIAGVFYLLMSGATIPTQRAFIASTVVFVGILLDRVAITMRLVGITALLLLLLTPESLLSVSFQMSFAAVVALVAVYERARLSGWLVAGKGSVLYRLWIYVVAVAVTSLVAGAATGFFAAFHFNNFASYGLLTNMAAVPLMGLWIMPWVLVLFVALPFGLEALPLQMVVWGNDLTLLIARLVAALPGADLRIPALPDLTMGLVVAGGLWLLLWTRAWRWWGLAPMMAGIAFAFTVRPSDILIDERGKVAAVRGAAGNLIVLGGGPKSFARETWLRRDAQLQNEESSVEGKPVCDSLGCIYQPARHPGMRIALVRVPDALPDDCAKADIVISAVPTFNRCRGPRVVIDRFDLWRGGAHAIWLDEDNVRVRTVAQEQGTRPWSLYARRTAEKSFKPQ